MDKCGHGKTGQFKVWSDEFRIWQLRSGEDQVKGISGQVMSVWDKGRLGVVCSG